MNNSNKYFRLYANCIPVKGAKGSLIYDFQRADVYKITNQFFDILPLIESKEFGVIIKENQLIGEFLEDMVRDEIGFFCNDPQLFPKLSDEWDTPGIISNTIIEYSKESEHNFKLIFETLQKLFCRNVLLMFYDIPSKTELYGILNLAKKYEVYYLEIWFNKKIPVNKLIKNFVNIRKIVVFNSKNDYVKTKGYCEIKYNTHSSFQDACKKTPVEKLLDYTFYTESLKFNTCLNKKLCIDKNKKIKNCPFLKTDFGNYGEIDIFELVKSDKFKEFWYLSKDKILVCKDCFYRYMCPDCRAFTIENNLNNKPVFCNFNPYE